MKLTRNQEIALRLLRARVAETDSELSGFIASCCKMADCH